MKFIFSLLVGAMVMVGAAVVAQERTAAGALQTQMTWSALSSQLQATRIYAEGVNSRVDQAVICAKKGMLYAPGDPTADTQGCLQANVDLTYLNKVIACGDNGQIYDKSADACVNATATKQPLTCSIANVSPQKISYFDSVCPAGALPVTEYRTKQCSECTGSYVLTACTVVTCK